MRNETQAAFAPVIIEDAQRPIYGTALKFIDVRVDQDSFCPNVFVVFAGMDIDRVPAILYELNSGLHEGQTFPEGARVCGRSGEDGQYQQDNGNVRVALFHLTLPPSFLYVSMNFS